MEELVATGVNSNDVVTRCPLCKTKLTESDNCSTCGSLEGLNTDDVPVPNRTFGYDWASGLVAPWKSQDGDAYVTSEEKAVAALEAAGLVAGEAPHTGRRRRRDVVVIDLGCGDATILRVAAKRYGATGLGYEIDPTALEDARNGVRRDGVERLVSIRDEDLMRVDLGADIVRSGAMTVVVTAFLLPATLSALQPVLYGVALRYDATVVTMKWQFGSDWIGKYDPLGFTVYRRPDSH